MRLTIGTSRDYLTTHLDLADVETQIMVLTISAEHIRSDLCPWCDGLHLIDREDGPEPCDHSFLDSWWPNQ